MGEEGDEFVGFAIAECESDGRDAEKEFFEMKKGSGDWRRGEEGGGK